MIFYIQLIANLDQSDNLDIFFGRSVATDEIGLLKIISTRANFRKKKSNPFTYIGEPEDSLPERPRQATTASLFVLLVSWYLIW